MMNIVKAITGLCISMPLVSALQIEGMMAYVFCFGVGALVSFIPTD